MSSSTLSLPLTVWHNYNNPITTCIRYHSSQVYAGQKDGTIWVFTLRNGMLRHKFLLVGHRAPIAALEIQKGEQVNTQSSGCEDTLISAAEDGEIARWSTLDGRCLAVNANGFFSVPRHLKIFPQFSDNNVFCTGQSSEICILNTNTLEVIRVWGGHANWVSCTSFYDAVFDRARLMTITIDGRLDVWDFEPFKQAIYKDRGVVNQPDIIKLEKAAYDAALDITGHPSIPNLCMVITRCNVMIFSLQNANFIPHVTIPAQNGTSWTGGNFCGQDKFVIYAQDGSSHVYNLVPPRGVRPGSMALEERQIYYSSTLLQCFVPKSADALCTCPSAFLHTDQSLQDPQPQLVVLNMSSWSDHSTFALHIVPDIMAEEQEKMSSYKETRFQDIWPLSDQTDPAFGYITSSAPVSSNHLAIGYNTGTICVVPFSEALLHLSKLCERVAMRSDLRVFEYAHNGPVTCMVVHESHHHQYLLSGGKDGAVKIWNLEDGKYVVSFTVHALPVESFIEPAEQKDTKIRGCVVSIAQDNSLALISVDSMSCLYIFPSHPAPLSVIQWRTAEDYVILGYQDETAYVWQLTHGYLDRIIQGKATADILEDERWPINRLSATSSNKTTSQKQSVNIRPLLSNNRALHSSFIFAHIFSFNVRRLVHTLYAKFEASRGTADWAPTPQPSISAVSYDAVVPDVTPLRPDSDDPLDVQQDTDKPDNHSLEYTKKLELFAALIAVCLSWNVSEALESVCARALLLQKKESYNNVSLGVKGTNGFLSVMAPYEDEKDAWKISQGLSASRLLSLALLSKAIIYVAGQETKSSDLIAGYSMALPAVVGKDYCFPSLSVLSKYWQDPSARSLFSSAVTGLSDEQVRAQISYWENYLPASNFTESQSPQMMARATIVLGIMGCDQPHTLNPSVRKNVALSLALMLSDSELDEKVPGNEYLATSSTSIARTLASMELLSQGFTTWEAYINAAEILRTMFLYASEPQPVLIRGAKNAIFLIAKSNITLVVGTLAYDTAHSKNTEERIRCLKLLGWLVRKDPVLLFSNVHRIVEAVVKTLDPNIPHLRDNVLSTATSVLHDLVKIYPFVDFSSSAQKLCAGTMEGASVIYDLRTATRSVVLEGHTGAVVALAFSPDAKFVATCSLQDQTVRVSYSNMSLLGVLTSSLSSGLRHETSSQKPGSRESSFKAYKVFSFALPSGRNGISDPSQIICNVHFEWPSPRCVRLHVRDWVMSFNV